MMNDECVMMNDEFLRAPFLIDKGSSAQNHKNFAYRCVLFSKKMTT
jgi:hypothetical protein